VLHRGTVFIRLRLRTKRNVQGSRESNLTVTAARKTKGKKWCTARWRLQKNKGLANPKQVSDDPSSRYTGQRRRGGSLEQKTLWEERTGIGCVHDASRNRFPPSPDRRSLKRERKNPGEKGSAAEGSE